MHGREKSTTRSNTTCGAKELGIYFFRFCVYITEHKNWLFTQISLINYKKKWFFDYIYTTYGVQIKNKN